MDEEKENTDNQEPKENLEEAYKEFNENLNKESDPEEESVEEPVEEEEPVGREIPKNPMFDENPASVDEVMREALTDTDAVELTHSDKMSYLKAVLNDVPVILDIPLCDGAINISIRSRTTWEQTCLYSAVKKDQEEGIIVDLSSVIIQLQKYGCILMVKSINDDPFPYLELDEKEPLEEAVEKLREKRQKEIETMSMPKWTIMLNALRVFETKIAQMGTVCLNENFWKPVD